MISVVICTHNPRLDHISRTLEALKLQTLPCDQWDLLIVDNASLDPLIGRIDLSWHPRAEIVCEIELGVAIARARGVREARGEYVLFVDDDNLLHPDYLKKAEELAAKWPQLGVWGCGSFTPEWEVEPAPHLRNHLSCLAVHTATGDRWSNLIFDYGATPPTAGMLVRTSVARNYAEECARNALRRGLGRKGGGLGACEDHDLAWTAVKLGYGMGIFTRLRMTHLISAGRVTEPYLLRLTEGHAYSTVLLHSLWDPNLKPPKYTLVSRLREIRYMRILDSVSLRFHHAKRAGERRAWTDLAAVQLPRS